jgi:hypothetical protein
MDRDEPGWALDSALDQAGLDTRELDRLVVDAVRHAISHSPGGC